ncbi:MAG: hypothetical protein RLN88_07315 [Ekhidna sp.]|uniref:hypothetical protein n=1 Tax=Ekhidna sp. TaxID=2608089 RepID=UPI0032ECE9FA
MKKKLYLLLLLITPLFLINCGSDDDGPDYLAELVGTWESTQIVTSNCPSADDNGTLTCDPFCINIEINADGTYTLQQANFDTQQIETETGTLTVTETTIHLCEDGESCDDNDPATYVKTSNTRLTVTFTSDGCQNAASFVKQ